MCAPPSTAAVTAAAVAQSRSAARLAAPVAGACRNDLRDGPDEQRPAESRQTDPIAARTVKLCSAASRTRARDRGSADPSGTPAPTARSTLRWSSRATSTDDVVVVRLAVHVARAVRACASGRARRRARATTRAQAGIILQATDVVDDGDTGVERAARRVRACRCRPKPAREDGAASPSAPGAGAATPPRRRSASAPGRVDSAPTSMMSAPSASMRERARRWRAPDRAPRRRRRTNRG